MKVSQLSKYPHVGKFTVELSAAILLLIVSQNIAKADAYTVQYGDSFYDIATKFGMSPYDLAAKKWKNNLRYYPSWRYVTSKWPNGYYC